MLASAFTTIFAIYVLNKDGDKYMENKYGKLWWTAPVIGHIGLNSIIIKENAEFYKSLKIKNKLFKDYRFVWMQLLHLHIPFIIEILSV